MVQAAGDRFRACPKGAKRGVDVGRMYGEIGAIVRAKFGNAGVDPDDLVQETAMTIERRNKLDCAFDPTVASFGKYVYLVASNVLGHLRGGAARRAHEVITVETEALDAHAHDEDREAARLDVTAGTVGELVEQLVDQAARARALAASSRGRRDEHQARYQEGAGDALRAVAELLASAFREEDLAPLPRRLLAVLSVTARALSPGQLSAAVIAPVAAVERALEHLGARVARDAGAFLIAPMHFEEEPPAAPPRSTSRRSSPSTSRPRRTSSRAGDTKAPSVVSKTAPTPAQFAVVSRTLTASLARWEAAARAA